MCLDSCWFLFTDQVGKERSRPPPSLRNIEVSLCKTPRPNQPRDGQVWLHIIQEYVQNQHVMVNWGWKEELEWEIRDWNQRRRLCLGFHETDRTQRKRWYQLQFVSSHVLLFESWSCNQHLVFWKIIFITKHNFALFWRNCQHPQGLFKHLYKTLWLKKKIILRK